MNRQIITFNLFLVVCVTWFNSCAPPTQVSGEELVYQLRGKVYTYNDKPYTGYVVNQVTWRDTSSSLGSIFQATESGEMVEGRKTKDWNTVLETGDTVSVSSWGTLMSETENLNEEYYVKYDFDRNGDTLRVADFVGGEILGWVYEYYLPTDLIGYPYEEPIGKNILKTKYTQKFGKKNGLAYEYHAYNKDWWQLVGVGYYDDDKKVGKWEESNNFGQGTYNYQDGVRHGEFEFHEEMGGGSSGSFKNGLAYGVWKVKNCDNNTSECIDERWRYIDGKRAGSQLVYDNELSKMVLVLYREGLETSVRREVGAFDDFELVSEDANSKSYKVGKEYIENSCIKVCGDDEKYQVTSFELSSIIVYENKLVVNGDMVDRLFNGVGLEKTTFYYDDKPPTRRSEEGGYTEMMYYGYYSFRVLGGGLKKVRGRVRVVYDPSDDGELIVVVLGVLDGCSFQVFF